LKEAGIIMSDYILSCSSTADMPKEFFENRNIPYIPFHFVLDGKEYKDDLGQTIPFEEFYSRIKKGSLPTTSQVNVGQFTEFFERYLKEGKDIIHISFSSGLSGSYNSAVIAKDELLEKYPNRKIEVVDSLSASSGYGFLVDKAADMRDQGKTVDEVKKWVEDSKLNVHHWFFSTDLAHYKRGGRISGASAFIGGMLKITPILNMNNKGELIPRKKIRGKKKAIKEMLSQMEDHAEDGLNYSGKCFISHSDSYEDARTLADLVEEKFSSMNGGVQINSVGTVIGSHTGPGTVALFFMGDEREE